MVLTMNNDNAKLERIKKSCRVGAKVTRILMIIMIVATVIGIAGGITILKMGPKYDEMAIATGNEQGFSYSYSSYSVLNVNMDINNMKSDVPALQEYIEKCPLAASHGVMILSTSLALILPIVLLAIINVTFKKMSESDTPFKAEIKKRILITMIILAVAVGLTMGLSEGALIAILAWIVTSILDYGISLQQQYDETL